MYCNIINLESNEMKGKIFPVIVQEVFNDFRASSFYLKNIQYLN